MPPQPGAIQVTDHLERRIRKPVDLLRCIISCIEFVGLAIAGIAASATTTGVEIDLVGVSKRLPHALLEAATPLTVVALFSLPVALAIQQLLRRQPRRLAEAVLTGVLAGLVTKGVDLLLWRSVSSRLYYAIIMSHPGVSHVQALDPYLAALVAYTTMIVLVGRPIWRNALWLAVGVYAIVQLVGTAHTTVIALLITLLMGRAIGLAVRYAAGSVSQRPSAEEIAAALAGTGLPVASIRRIRLTGPGHAGSRYYAVSTQDGGRLDVTVFDRDQEAAGAFYRLYRAARLQGQVSRNAPLSVDHTVERRALLSYATEDAGVSTPRLRALVRVGPEAAVLAYDHHEGTTLAQRNPGATDAELARILEVVKALHAHHVTHRGLTADHILFTGDDHVMLLDPGEGDVAATDLQVRLDLSQLITELALFVGPDRAAELAIKQIGASELVSVVPLMQPVALARSTRKALRRRRDVLPALRTALLAAVPGGEVAPVRLERIRLRTLLTLVASVVAAYLLAGELERASLGHVLGEANLDWAFAALALSVVTYVAAAISLSGFVGERLNFFRTLLAQVAGSFVTLVTPAAVGGAALNVRYLLRKKIPAPVAVASVGVAQVVAFILHIMLIAVFAAIAGTGPGEPLKPPRWAYFVLAGLVLAALAVLAVPASRRLVRARVSPTFTRVWPRLLEILQRPRKLAEGVGGALLLSFAYIFCLAACVAAFGRSVPIASIAVVYLTGSALGSLIPTPGGLGAVEAALTAGLTAAGLPGAVAVSSVLLFRLLTFWLPVPFGWAALNYLERKQAL